MSRVLAVALVIVGVVATTAGAALIFVPAGVIVFGGEVLAAGLLLIDVERTTPGKASS